MTVSKNKTWAPKTKRAGETSAGKAAVAPQLNVAPQLKTDAGFPLAWAAIIAILLVGALALGTYLASGAPAIAPPANPAANQTPAEADPMTHPAAIAMMSSLNLVARIPDTYEIVFAEKVDNVDSNISLRQSKTARSVAVATAFNLREYYWTGNKTIACEQTHGEARHCTMLADSTLLSNYAKRLDATFPSREIGALRTLNTQLIRWGAIRFSAPPQKMEVAGRSCQNLIYTLNYRNLSDRQLSEINMTPADPMLRTFDNFKFEQCVDAQWGLALKSKMSYNAAGHPQMLERRYLRVVSPLTAPISPPASDVNESELEGTFVKNNQQLRTMGGCATYAGGADRDRCYLSNAAEFGRLEFCGLASNQTAQDQCVMVMAVLKDRPEYCKEARTLLDECYVNIAAGRKDVSFCNLVANATNRALCKNAVNVSDAQGVAPSNASRPNDTYKAVFPARGAID